MIIGVPKERKTFEKRIALTPDGAKELRKRGHEVLVETGAGLGAHFEDERYREVGCKLVSSLKEVWTNAEMIVTVKEPHESEYEFFRPGLILFDYLHLAGLPEVTKVLLQGKVTGIAYELVQTETGRLPLLEPMSEVAGKLSVLNGSYFLLSQNGGRGTLLGGTVGVPARIVVIVGAGVSGKAACEIALGMGARVTVLDIDYQKLERIKYDFGNRARTIFSTPVALEREVARADLLIGAVLIPGAAAPKIITRSMIRSMKRGSVFVDISIDQGGCAETIHTTSLENPIYVEEGVTHYGVPNMPAQTARTSTLALTVATLPYILQLADKGAKKALLESKPLHNALNTHQGLLTNAKVSEAVGIKYTSIEDALKN